MENQLLNIKINQDDINAAIANAAKARTELDKLKASNKELAKQKKELIEAEGDQSEAINKLNSEITKNNTEIKRASAVVRENEKVVTTNTQAQESNEGSITQLRKQLVLVSKQWADLSEEERENEEIGGKLAKQKLDLTEKLKAEEKATGDTRRNVGNYSESVKEALAASGSFGKGLVGMIGGLNAATVASLKFLATPLGAVIGALGLAISAVVGAFSLFKKSLERSEKGQATLSKVTKTFSGIMNGVLKVLEPLATTVLEGVANGFDAIGKAAGKAAGILEKGLRFFGLNKAADNVKKYSEAIEESVKSTRELADAQVELNKVERQQEQLQLDFQNRAEKLRQIRDDESKSIQERIKANEELGKVLDKQSASELALAQKSLEIAQLRAKVEGESKDNLDAVADAETKILEIEERITGQRSEQLVNINSLKKEQLEAIKEKEAAEKAATDRAIAEKQRELEEKQRIEREFQDLATQREELRREEEKVKLQEQRAEGLLTREEYEQALLQIELDTLETARLAAEEAKQAALESTEITEAERQRIILESEGVILAARKRTAELSISAQKDVVKATGKIEDAKVEQAKVSSDDIISATQGVAKEGSVAAKAAGVAQATISTYTAAAKALEIAPPFGAILAALITAKGLLNVNKIVSTPTPSFASGGFTGDGYGTADSSGYKPAGIVHEGEYVIKKSMVDNPAFSGVISALETSRLKGYADGGFVSRAASTPASEGAQASQLQATLSDIKNIQPIVRVTDINRVSQQQQMVQVSGELS